jgi:hypothetical protein
MNFQIIPYQGIPPLMFGMQEAEVLEIFGQAEYRSRLIRDPFFRVLGYEGMTFGFDDQSGLSEVNLGEGFMGAVVFSGINVFSDRNALLKLIRLDGEPWEWVGFIMLMNLGISLGGYHTQADEGKTISIFKRGRYESRRHRFERFVP